MFTSIENMEMMEIDGGFVITGTMIGVGAGILASGVAVGYAVGTIIEYFIEE